MKQRGSGRRFWGGWAAALLLASALGGCTLSGGLPAPTISSVLPATEPAGTSATVTIVGTGFDLAVATQLSSSTGKAGAVTASIGGVALTQVARFDAEHLTGTLDGSLAPGSYPVTVKLPNGRTATLDKAFTITAPMEVALTLPAKLMAGGSDTGTLTLTSVTGATLDLSLVSLAPTGTSALAVTPPTLPATLAPFATTSVTVAVSLPADATDTSATVDAKVRWALPSTSGEAETSASIALVPMAAIGVAFDSTPPKIEVGQSADLPITVTNAGQVPLSAVAVTVTGDAQATVGTQPVLSTTSLAPAATATGTVSITGAAAGTSTLSADVSGDDGSGGAPITASTTATIEVMAGPGPALSFGTVPQTAVIGTAVSIDVTLANNGDVDLTGATVTLAATGADVAPASQTADVVGGSSATLTFTVTPTAIGGPVDLTATASGASALSGATFTATPATASIAQVTGPPPAALTFTTAAVSVPASTCSGVVTVGLLDGSGQPATATSNTTVTLTSDDATLVFYADATCATTTTTVLIPAGQSTVDLAFATPTVGTPTLTASATGLTAATQTETVTAPPAPASLTFVSPPVSMPVSTCSGIVTVGLLDGSGNPVTATSTTSITLTSNDATLVFYSDSTCATTATSVVIPAGQSTIDLAFMSTTVGTPTITASATGLAAATQTETITPALPSLTFTTAPLNVAATTCAGPVTVGLLDSTGAPTTSTTDTTVVLTSSSSQMSFYSDAACGTATNLLVIPAGQPSADVYIVSDAVGSPTITAAANGFLPATQTETVTGPPPVALTFVTAPVTIATGACATPVTVGLVDGSGNPAFTTSDTTVTLTSSDATLGFYGDPACGVTATTAIIPAGRSSVDLSFSTPTVGSPTITASATGLTAATQTETVTPPPPVDVRIVDPPPGSGRTVPAGTTFAVDVGALAAPGHTVSQLSLSVTGPATVTSPTPVTETTQTAVATFTVSIPAGTAAGSTVTLTATAQNDTGGTATSTPSVITVGPTTLVSLSCQPGDFTLIKGLITQVFLVATMSDGTVVDVSGQASWVSSDTGLAPVADGVVKGNDVGTVEVSGVYQGQDGICTVTVVNDTYVVRPERVLLSPGSSGSLRYLQIQSGIPNDLTGKSTLTWTSSDPAVVTANGTGGITAGQAGTATLTICGSASSCATATVIVASDPVIDASAGGPVGISGSQHFHSLVVESGGVLFGYGSTTVDLQIDSRLVVGAGGTLVADGEAAPAVTVNAPDSSLKGWGGNAGPGGGGGGAGSGDGTNTCNGSMCGGAGTPVGQNACRNASCGGGSGGGPGGGGGAPPSVSTNAGDAGGGGGSVGGGGQGGSASAATYAGAGGVTPGTTAASGASGGGGGDGGGGTEGPGGGGGGGGGAITITGNAGATIRIDGLVGARGGAGGDDLNAAVGGPGGGGGGGYVTITASAGTITGTGRASARGGRGGNGERAIGACGGGGGGGGGSVTLTATQPGPFLLARALGGRGGLACAAAGTPGDPGAVGTVTRQ